MPTHTVQTSRSSAEDESAAALRRRPLLDTFFFTDDDACGSRHRRKHMCSAIERPVYRQATSANRSCPTSTVNRPSSYYRPSDMRLALLTTTTTTTTTIADHHGTAKGRIKRDSNLQSSSAASISSPSIVRPTTFMTEMLLLLLIIGPSNTASAFTPQSSARSTSSRKPWTQLPYTASTDRVPDPRRSRRRNGRSHHDSPLLQAVIEPTEFADSALETDIFVTLDGDQVEIEEADMRYAATKQMTESEEAFYEVLEGFLQMIPIYIPILAYLTYDPLAKLFAHAVELLANRNWVAVDGGAYQAKIIAPAINGVVVPSISILFATLIGTTISTLRERQANIGNALNMEAGQIRILQSMMESIPPSMCDTTKCRRYMMEYVSRLIAESQATVKVNELGGSLDSELNAVLKELNTYSFKDNIPGSILGESYATCSRLYEHRAKRITALRSGFPLLHYAIVVGLAMSICLAFLLESNQQLLVFLNAIQLRILWTMLLGTFSALAIVCYDLIEPFRGSYQVSQSVDQLYVLRLSLLASLDDHDSVKKKDKPTADDF